MADVSESQTWASLLGAVRDRGDHRAWEVFCARYESFIRESCRRHGITGADADDLTQVVLLKLLEAMPGFVYDPRRGFRKYLRKVIKNSVADHRRRESRRPGDQGGGDPRVLASLEADPAANGADIEDLVKDLESRLEQDGWLGAACARVRAGVEERTWRAFWLSVVGGLSGAEVAVKLGMAVTTVYMAKSRVLKKIQQEIGPDGNLGGPDSRA